MMVNFQLDDDKARFEISKGYSEDTNGVIRSRTSKKD
jgi:hypothetical protein